MLVRREHRKRDNVYRIKSQNNDVSNRLNNCNAITQSKPPRVVLSTKPRIELKQPGCLQHLTICYNYWTMILVFNILKCHISTEIIGWKYRQNIFIYTNKLKHNNGS